MSEAAVAAAFWSALAATCAAMSSFFIFLVQRRNLLESVRPEIVLTDWRRYEVAAGLPNAHEVVEFKTLRNVGRGAALHVYMNCAHIVDNFPVAVMSTRRIAVVGANESLEVASQVSIWWKNVKPTPDGGKFCPLEIRIFCWDSRSLRHETVYSLVALEDTRTGVNELAPGLMFGHRRTYARAVWLLKTRTRLAKLAVIGRLFSDK